MNYISLKSMIRYLLTNKTKIGLILMIVLLGSLAYGFFNTPEAETPVQLSETAKVQQDLNERYKKTLSSLRPTSQVYPQIATEEVWETVTLYFVSPVEAQRQDKLTNLYYGIDLPDNLLSEFNRLAKYDYSLYQFNRLWRIELNSYEGTIKVFSYAATKEASTFLASALTTSLEERHSSSVIDHQLILVDQNTLLFDQKETYEFAKDYFDNAQKARRELLYPKVKTNIQPETIDLKKHYLKFAIIGLVSGLSLAILWSIFKSSGKHEYFSLMELKRVGFPIVGAYSIDNTKQKFEQKLISDIPLEDEKSLIDRLLIMHQRMNSHIDAPLILFHDSEININNWLQRAEEFGIKTNPVSMEDHSAVSKELIKNEPVLIISNYHNLLLIEKNILELLPFGSIMVVSI